MPGDKAQPDGGRVRELKSTTIDHRMESCRPPFGHVVCGGATYSG